jgi:hypothetical protein
VKNLRLKRELLLITMFFLLLGPLISIHGKQVKRIDETAVDAVTGSNGLVYSTLLGGSNDDYGCAIVRDSLNNTVIAGITYSADFPVTEGAYVTPHRGGSDVFVSKIAENGTLLFSAIIGGSDDETEFIFDNNFHIVEIALDSADNIIIQGTTQSSDFPVTEGAHDTTFNDGTITTETTNNRDVFIAKLSADGSKLLFGTFLGGSSADVVTLVTGGTITLDDADNIYVTGLTASSDFPITPDAIQSVHIGHGTDADAFITKLSADGTEILYSTFLGGSLHEACASIALDGENNIIIGGWTASSDFPTTANANDATHNGNDDGFIAKISVGESTLAFSTFLGGSDDDLVTAITIDEKGDIYAAGETFSSDYPVTNGANDTVHGGSREIFVTKFSSDGTELKFSTFLGGSGDDAPFGMVLDNEKSIYVVGFTSSSDFQVTPTDGSTASTAINGELDYTITQISPEGSFLQYSSYLGGSGSEIPNHFSLASSMYPHARVGSPAGIELVSKDKVIVVGTTDSTDFPVTADAFNKTHAGGYDVFITQLAWIPLEWNPPTTASSNDVPGFEAFVGVIAILAVSTLVWYSNYRKRNK